MEVGLRLYQTVLRFLFWFSVLTQIIRCFASTIQDDDHTTCLPGFLRILFPDGLHCSLPICWKLVFYLGHSWVRLPRTLELPKKNLTVYQNNPGSLLKLQIHRFQVLEICNFFKKKNSHINLGLLKEHLRTVTCTLPMDQLS